MDAKSLFEDLINELKEEIEQLESDKKQVVNSVSKYALQKTIDSVHGRIKELTKNLQTTNS